MEVIQKIQSEIENRNLLEKGEKIILGVSGGVDSSVLLDILVKIGDDDIVVAHMDHGLRETSNEDLQFAAKKAAYYNSKFESYKCDIQELARQNKVSLEEMGRLIRYRFFKDLAKKYQATKIVTAHTASDQVETVILNLMRGGGVRGYQGIPWKRKLTQNEGFFLVRPMLSTWKSEIISYAEKYKISFREDETNKDFHFLRNKIRHTLLPRLSPRLCEGRSPVAISNFEEKLWTLSQRATFLETKLQRKVEDLFLNLVKSEKNAFTISLDHLRKDRKSVV